MSFPTGTQQPTVPPHPSSIMNPVGILPASHMTAVTTATYHPGPAESFYHNAPGRGRQDNITQPQYAIAGRHPHHTTYESSYEPTNRFPSPRSIPAFGKCLVDAWHSYHLWEMWW